MKHLELTQGKVAIVDDEDYKWLKKWKWCFMPMENVVGYAYRKIGIKSILLHRVILKPNNGEIIDHVNMCGLDNRKCNLRVCSHSQNKANRNAPSNNTSGYKGITWSEKRKKWQAKIQIDSRTIPLGRFLTKEEAALAYNKALAKHFGEFARLNQI